MIQTDNGLPALLPALQSLSRADKLRLMQHLANELAREEGVAPVERGAAYPVWTPQHAFEAADVLLKALEQGGPTP
jgi:hypothetical protein